VSRLHTSRHVLLGILLVMFHPNAGDHGLLILQSMFAREGSRGLLARRGESHGLADGRVAEGGMCLMGGLALGIHPWLQRRLG
jgi:hypothetical protein